MYISISEQEQSAIKVIVQSQVEFPVDFDDAWQWVGYSRKDSAKDALIRNFEEEVDFSGIHRKTPSGGRPSERIYLTIDCFKQFCMMAGTERGKEVRKYFLQCEKELKEIKAQPQFQVPTSLPEALRMAADLAEQKVLLETKVAVMEPKVEVYDQTMGASGWLTFAEVSKVLNIPGMGRNNLIKFLRMSGIINGKNEAYQTYVDRGYFKLKVTFVQHLNSNTSQTMTSPAGLEFILKELKKGGYQPRSVN
ncbi:hypothetical protein LEP3755_34330 [Leptolyngbya sp. NIES-3755]|nr:hypothetical protein LEP3755_34330 [Leptolyngbya sp. NIES-3755]